MKATAVLILAVLLALPFGIGSASGTEVGGNTSSKVEPSKIRIVFNEQEIIVEMFDNPASRDFLSLLPLTLEFSDYAGVEKITYLPRRLTTANSSTTKDSVGDFTYYAPWGNLAVFYKGFGHDARLYVLGRIVSGKEKLGAMSQTFSARIEELK